LEAGLDDENKEFEHLNQEHSQIANELNIEDRSLANISQELSNIHSDILKLQAEKSKLIMKKPELEKMYQEQFKSLKVTEDTLEVQINQCLEYSPRVPVTKTTGDIEKELRNVNAQLKEKEKEFGSRKKFFGELTALRDKYEASVRDIREFEEILQLVNKARKMRRKKFEKFKNFISVRSMRIFAELMKKRGYRGVLELNHDVGTLGLKVLSY
jgi:structural maintenance of chromosomes protein 6